MDRVHFTAISIWSFLHASVKLDLTQLASNSQQFLCLCHTIASVLALGLLLQAVSLSMAALAKHHSTRILMMLPLSPLQNQVDTNSPWKTASGVLFFFFLQTLVLNSDTRS